MMAGPVVLVALVGTVETVLLVGAVVMAAMAQLAV